MLDNYTVKLVPIEDFDYVFLTCFPQEPPELQDKPDIDRVKQVFTTLYATDMGALFGLYDEELKAYVGVLGALTTPDMFSGAQQAQELFWYVSPKHRGHGVMLISTFEEWAVEHNAKYAIVCHCARMPEKIGSFYRGLDYKIQDRLYVKEL